MLVVAALGGNALLRRHQPATAEAQRSNIRAAVQSSLAPLARQHRLVVTHGNGPQIGLLALQSLAIDPAAAWPLDILGAESQGMIGYVLAQELDAALPGRQVAVLVSDVEVDLADPAFATPDKPIGPLYEQDDMLRLSRDHDWRFIIDGTAWRRVVASPRPLRLRQLASVRCLLQHDVIVVCAGGGGVPVARAADGRLRGVEAVIDKDFSAAMIAGALKADALLLLTDIDAVWTRWPADHGARPIGRTTPAALRGYDFAAGSMAPKVAAACAFVEQGGRLAAIGALTEAESLLAGRCGTFIQSDG